MTIDLPQAIAAYFAADKRDGNAVARCFTEQATVKDEGHTYTGREAIRRWRTDTSAKFDYVSEPFAITTKDGVTVVISRETSPAARSTCVTSSVSKATRSPHWRSRRELRS